MILLTRLHPAVVHFPIALLSLATLAGLLYIYGRPHSALLTLTWWPLRLGWLGGIAALLTGLLAQQGLPPNAPYRAVLNLHITTGIALTVLYGLLLYLQWRFGSSKAQKQRARANNPARDLLDDPRGRFGFTGLAIAGWLMVFASGWNGGQLVFEWGVNVVPQLP